MLEIVKHPDRTLKKRCAAITMVGEEEKEILCRMVKAMYANRGIGLAAPQVGIDKNLAVVDIGDNKVIKLINPAVVERKGEEVMEEGCLSVPDVFVKVKRAKQIKIEFLDENGKKTALEASDLLARAILHEIDHLNGKLIIDHLNPIERFFRLKKK